MDALGELVARDRLGPSRALEAGGDPPRRYDYRRFCTTVWKTGNFLSHLGVRAGTTVAVTDRRAPESVFAFLGAALLGARTRFAPSPGPDCRALVAPTADLDEYTLPPGGTRVGYGDRPTDPGDSHFETEMWSENPTFPDVTAAGGDDPALETPDRTYSHAELLAAGGRVVDAYDIAEDSTVAVGTPLARPATVVAGVVAPLLAGATVELAGEGAVTVRAAGDERAVDLDAVDA